MFAFRIIVDIASKALSPAINDPTTAVLAIDQIHHLLRDIGKRSLAEGREADRNGQVRLHLSHAKLGRLCATGDDGDSAVWR